MVTLNSLNFVMDLWTTSTQSEPSHKYILLTWSLDRILTKNTESHNICCTPSLKHADCPALPKYIQGLTLQILTWGNLPSYSWRENVPFSSDIPFSSAAVCARRSCCQGTQPNRHGRGNPEAHFCHWLWHDCNLLPAYQHQNSQIRVKI